MPLWKKILFSALFIIVAVGMGYLIFRVFFFAPAENANVFNYNINGLPNANLVNRVPVNGNISVNAGLPNANRVGGYTPPSEVASGGSTLVKPVVEEGAQDLVMASNKQDIIYYNSFTGEFKKISQDGSKETLLTEETFPSAEDIYWSPSRDKAVLSFPDQSKIVYDFNQDRQYSLPKETTEFSFSPGSDQLVYKYEGYDLDDRWLAVSNPDGSGAEIIEALGDKASQVTVNWSPNNQIVAAWAKTVDQDQQEIIFLGKNNENFPAIEVQGRGFKHQWSPGGDKILYSVFDSTTNYNPSLWIMDGSINNLGGHPLELNIQTWPDKCSFGGGDSLYCAVPIYLPAGADIYPELAQGIADEFYRIDLETGAQTLLAAPIDSSGNTNFSAQNVYLSANEEFMYFTDINTGNLYKIRLK